MVVPMNEKFFGQEEEEEEENVEKRAFGRMQTPARVTGFCVCTSQSVSLSVFVNSS
jgi:hypothetical protein